jgi:hypothetical protein
MMAGLGVGFVTAVFGLRATGAAARLGRVFLSVVIRADRRRKDVGRNGLAFIIRIFAIAVDVARAAFGALGPLGTFRAFIAVAARAALRTVIGLGLGFGGLDVLALILVTVVTALTALLFVSSAAFIEHAEIVIGELEIIFGLDTVPGELRVAGHVLVFFKQLRRVATLAIVAGVATVAGHALGTLSTATTTAAALTVVDQTDVPCRTCAAMAALFHVIPSTEEAIAVPTRPAACRFSFAVPDRERPWHDKDVGLGGATSIS